MVKFVITDGKGYYIRRDDASGKYVPVNGRNAATEFDQRTKAANILKNSVTKEVRKRYHIKTENDCQESEQSGIPVELRIDFSEKKEEEKIELAASTNMVFDSKIDEIVSSLSSAKYIIEITKNRVDKLNEMLGIVNSEINDILHYIEFTNLNLYQAWLIYKLLKETRRKRRAIKDELLVLEKIGDGDILTEQLINNALHSADGLKTRKYDPRSLSILFKGVDSHV